MIKKIVIKGAKEHNLKNVSVEIPKDQFVVIRLVRIRKVFISL